MSSFWNFLFGLVLVIVWIIAGGFATQANILLSPYKNKDSEFHKAYWFTFWAAFVTWTLIGLFILLVVLSVMGVVALFGSGVGEAAEVEEVEEVEEVKEVDQGSPGEFNSQDHGEKTAISWFTVAFLVFSLILVGITGVLSAISASSMKGSSSYDPGVSQITKAYSNCVIASIMCISAGALLIIGILVYMFIGVREQSREQSRERREEEIREREY